MKKQKKPKKADANHNPEDVEQIADEAIRWLRVIGDAYGVQQSKILANAAKDLREIPSRDLEHWEGRLHKGAALAKVARRYNALAIGDTVPAVFTLDAASGVEAVASLCEWWLDLPNRCRDDDELVEVAARMGEHHATALRGLAARVRRECARAAEADGPKPKRGTLGPLRKPVRREPSEMQMARRSEVLQALPASDRVALDGSAALLRRLHDRQNDARKREQLAIRHGKDSARRDVEALRDQGLVHAKLLLRTLEGDREARDAE